SKYPVLKNCFPILLHDEASLGEDLRRDTDLRDFHDLCRTAVGYERLIEQSKLRRHMDDASIEKKAIMKTN
ncbi:MAG TPA: hypothetical protein V6C88_08945, partial [Chroococcidiopsis sp.]